MIESRILQIAVLSATVMAAPCLTAAPPGSENPVSVPGIVQLDLGDILAGGDGCGALPVGDGLKPTDGGVAVAGVFGGNAAIGPAFIATDGQGVTANLDQVDGVFSANGPTPIDSSGGVFRFPFTTGLIWDAIRNGVAVLQSSNNALPIDLNDQPGVERRGIGLHSTSGVTFDLDGIRAANPGASILGFKGVAGLNQDPNANGGDVDIWVIVDGRKRYSGTFGAPGDFESIEVPISDTARFLTLACTDFDQSNGNDHGVIADAVLVVFGPPDCNQNDVSDVCDLIHGTSADCDNSGFPDECDGQFEPIDYGHGCPGTGGFEPTVAMAGCLVPGGGIQLVLADGLGGSLAFLFLGLNEVDLPVTTLCSLNVGPPGIPPLVVPLGGIGPGNGASTLFGALPASISVSFTMQTFVADPGVAAGFSASKGLLLDV